MSDPAATRPAKELLERLYADDTECDADFDATGDPALMRLRDACESGDEALRKLMSNLAFTKFDGDSDQAARVAAALGAIMQYMVNEVLDGLPTTTVADLRDAADAAGWDIEILG